MKRLVIVIPALLLAGQAEAISRYQTTSMSCARVQSAVATDGAAILHYPAPGNPSLDRFDRYVRDKTFCTSTQRAQRVRVPAADTSSCPVNRCVRAGGGNR
jgi:hypothetical protein